MVKYLFASHGKFAKGTESFLRIMVGGKENVYTINAFIDEKSIDVSVREKLAEIGDFDQLVIFCDIYGGSVCQEVFRQVASTEKNIQLIAGYNLALVMEIMLRDSVLTKEEILDVIEQSKESIKYVELKQQIIEDNDELF
ncbi:MAG: hypothetical protein Q4C64_01555 [Erysipelotrichia bacterium]|nr:hypothetical protein [Erysipelotrichia bacterium]